MIVSSILKVTCGLTGKIFGETGPAYVFFKA